MKIGQHFMCQEFGNLGCDASARFSVLGCGTEISALTARVCISVGASLEEELKAKDDEIVTLRAMLRLTGRPGAAAGQGNFLALPFGR